MRLPRTIYAIQHNKTKRIYIGSSHDVKTRCYAHRASLRAGKHPVEDMQQDFDDYGEDFTYFILGEIKNYKDRIKEYEWMDKYNSWERGVGYNYKDHFRKTKVLKDNISFVCEEPTTPTSVTKENVYELVNMLTSSQIAYIHTFIKKMFFNEGM